jgi:type VI secretion system protein ImpI
MTLTLHVTGPQAATLGRAEKTFGEEGGTIGRVAANAWVLPDRMVSSYHARVLWRDNTFYIEDTGSTNGVFVNDTRLAANTPQPIASGDVIFIEPYEIRASIETRASMAVDARQAFGVNDPFGFAEPAVSGPLPTGELDPLRALGYQAPQAAPAAPRAVDLQGRSALDGHYRPPAPVLPIPDFSPAADPFPPGGIPADYDPLSSAPSLPAMPLPVMPPAPPAAPESRETPPSARAQAPPPVRPQAPAPAGPHVTLAEVLAGAGIEHAAVTPELARGFGKILRVVVSGVMDVLQARQRIKEEFRIRRTTFMPRENNPLKHSANVDDALHNLLVKRNAAYLGPVEAFEDAFDDVRNHQMAMLAGVRAGVEKMLREFDPDRLQQEFDREPRNAVISMPARLRYWDQYREKVHGILEDADTSFRELFGEEFARAYEEQLERLKGRDRGDR